MLHLLRDESVDGSHLIGVSAARGACPSADIRTTMNVYGGALDDTMREYNGKVVRMALRAS